MNLQQLDPHPTVHDAPRLALRIAETVRDTPGVIFRGPRPAQGGVCSMCSRPTGKRNLLYEIVLDPVMDEGIRIGIDRCCGHHLKGALTSMLAGVNANDSPDKQGKIDRLRAGIDAV